MKKINLILLASLVATSCAESNGASDAKPKTASESESISSSPIAEGCRLTQWYSPDDIQLLHDLLIVDEETIIHKFDSSTAPAEEILNVMKSLYEEGTCAFDLTAGQVCSLEDVGTGVKVNVGNQVFADWLWQFNALPLFDEMVRQELCAAQ